MQLTKNTSSPQAKDQAQYDRSYWAAAFKAFRKNSNEFERFENFISRNLELAVYPVLRKPCAQKSRSVLEVLSIGCGAGEPDMIFVENVKLRFPPLFIHYTALDPSIKLLKSMEASIEAKNQLPEYQDVVFEFCVDTAESFQPTKKFDLIFMIQVLFFIKDEHAILEKYLHALQPNGVIIIVLPKRNGPLERSFLELKLPRYHYKGNARPSLSCDVKEALDRMPGCSYDVLHYSAHTDIEHSFDPQSEEGQLVLDFVLDLYRHRETLTPAQLDQLMQFLRSDGICRTVDGRRCFIQDMDFYVVRNQ